MQFAFKLQSKQTDDGHRSTHRVAMNLWTVFRPSALVVLSPPKRTAADEAVVVGAVHPRKPSTCQHALSSCGRPESDRLSRAPSRILPFMAPLFARTVPSSSALISMTRRKHPTRRPSEVGHPPARHSSEDVSAADPCRIWRVGTLYSEKDKRGHGEHVTNFQE